MRLVVWLLSLKVTTVEVAGDCAEVEVVSVEVGVGLVKVDGLKGPIDKVEEADGSSQRGNPVSGPPPAPLIGAITGVLAIPTERRRLTEFDPNWPHQFRQTKKNEVLPPGARRSSPAGAEEVTLTGSSASLESISDKLGELPRKQDEEETLVTVTTPAKAPVAPCMLEESFSWLGAQVIFSRKSDCTERKAVTAKITTAARPITIRICLNFGIGSYIKV